MSKDLVARIAAELLAGWSPGVACRKHGLCWGVARDSLLDHEEIKAALVEYNKDKVGSQRVSIDKKKRVYSR